MRLRFRQVEQVIRRQREERPRAVVADDVDLDPARLKNLFQ
jgi:hypothetical protein